MADLRAIWTAGRVMRWHIHPHLAGSGDRLDGHHARVARIILALHPEPSVDILRAALTHDDGEAVTGDRPYGFTPCDWCGDAEMDARDEMWGDKVGWVSCPDGAWLRFADSLDAYLWAQHHAPQIMDQHEWQAHRGEIIALARALGVEDKVREALDA